MPIFARAIFTVVLLASAIRVLDCHPEEEQHTSDEESDSDQDTSISGCDQLKSFEDEELGRSICFCHDQTMSGKRLPRQQLAHCIQLLSLFTIYSAHSETKNPMKTEEDFERCCFELYDESVFVEPPLIMRDDEAAHQKCETADLDEIDPGQPASSNATATNDTLTLLSNVEQDDKSPEIFEDQTLME